MTAIHETAYPRIRSNLSDAELQELYTPTPSDLEFARRATKSTGTELGLLVLLKTFQRLSYFPRFEELPSRLLNHIAAALETSNSEQHRERYEARSYRGRHLPLVREYLGIIAFSDGGRRVLLGALLDAARSKDILADIINVGIEALVHARYELPAFSTLRRVALKARSQVNTGYYQHVSTALDDMQRATLLRLMTRADIESTSLWQQLKREPKQPTPKQLREHLAHTRWLQSLNTARQTLDGIPETKLQRFADEARAADISRMNEMLEAKRVALAVALIRVRTAQARDDLAKMFIRRMQQLHNKAKEALDEYRRQHQEQTDALVALLERLVTGWQASDRPKQRLQTINALIGPDADTIREQCEAHMAYAGNNYLPFLPRVFRAHRKTCLDVLAFLQPVSTSTDTTLEHAIRFVVQHRDTRMAELPVRGNGQPDEETLDGSWIPPSWWKAVTGTSRREEPVATVDRKYLEFCA